VFRPAGGLTDGSGHGTADAAAALKAAAAIAKPVPPRAGAGAVPRTLPAAPSVPFIDKSLGRTLLRDALISLAVLIVLLVPIVGYALVRRRRTRARMPARADRELGARGARSAYVPGTGSGHGDEMLEYFAAMPAEPSGAGAGRTFADTHPAASQGGTAGRLPVTPMTRAFAPRSPAKVAGSPPWEPAAKPDGELPWTASLPGMPPRSAPSRPEPAAPRTGPAAPGRGSAPTADPAPGGAAWVFSPAEASRGRPVDDDAPQAAGLAESGRSADKNETADKDRPAGEGQRADENGTTDKGRPAEKSRPMGESGTADKSWPEDEDGTADESGEPDSGPIYVWNPSASTESFPIVPRDG
jgi:hypothetical protein